MVDQSLQDASSDFATRLSGGVEAVGGVIEAAAGTALAAAASWTGIGLLAGGAVAAHGFDVALAGLQQAVTGQSADSLTSDALQSAGLSRSTANAIDSGISFAGSLGSASVAASISAAETATIDPALVRFSQDSIGATFKNGGSINDLVAGLNGAGGEALAAKIPPIRLVEQDGLLYTLDNRRLAAFSMTDFQVPYRMATAEEIAAEWSAKFTTTAEQGWGQYITIRPVPWFNP